MQRTYSTSIRFKDNIISLSNIAQSYRRGMQDFRVELVLNPDYQYFVHAGSVDGINLTNGLLYNDGLRVTITDRDAKIIRVLTADYPHFSPMYVCDNKFNFQAMRISENARNFKSIYWEDKISLDEPPTFASWLTLDKNLNRSENYILSKIGDDPILRELYDCGQLDNDLISVFTDMRYIPANAEDVLNYSPSRIFDAAKITAVVVYTDSVNNPTTVINLPSLNKILTSDGDNWFMGVKYIIIQDDMRTYKLLFSDVDINSPIDVINKFSIAGDYRCIRITDAEIREKANAHFKDVHVVGRHEVQEFISKLDDIKELLNKERDSVSYLVEYDDGFAHEIVACYFYGVDAFVNGILEHISYTDFNTAESDDDLGLRKLIQFADRECE